jgi:predicted RNA-binding Zn-ribbon protein involved in translation (DUF1610 family)
MNSSLENAHLNKVFRAVHDGVCPKCGTTSLAIRDQKLSEPGRIYYCKACDFFISDKEKAELGRLTVPEWGAKLIETFDNWRKNRLNNSAA